MKTFNCKKKLLFVSVCMLFLVEPLCACKKEFMLTEGILLRVVEEVSSIIQSVGNVAYRLDNCNNV